jgi:hypothetical protein
MIRTTLSATARDGVDVMRPPSRLAANNGVRKARA